MITLQIAEDGAFIELENNGRKEFRECDIDTLIDILNRAVREVSTDEVIESPMLPVNTIKFDRSANTNDYTLYMYREPVIDQITFESRSYVVGYPAIIYGFKVVNEVVSRVEVWAVKDKVLTPETQIYHYPFFNVSQDGRMCIGTNKITIEEPWQLHKMPDILKAMPSNLGLQNNNNSGLEGDSILKAIENKPFPHDWLAPTNKTLKKVLKRGSNLS